MKKNIVVVLIFLTSIITIVYITINYPSSTSGTIIIGILVNIISSPLYLMLVEGLYSLKNFRLFWKSCIVYRNTDVRFSISYIFRIKVKGKYLLVKNRKGNYYQPVGGAYKTLPSSQPVFKKFNINPDSRYETSHGITKNDLRFRVKGKFVFGIIKWFKSKENRETSQWREFCEELLTTNLINDKHAFRYIDYEYSGTLITPMKKAKKLECQEILIYEIFDLITNTEQQKELERLHNIGDTADIKFADEKLINSLGFDERSKEIIYEIGAHTKWTLNEKWTEE